MSNKSSGKFFFRDWVLVYGQARLAHDIGVDRSTVNKWLRESICPKAKDMRRIKALSNGFVDYHHMIENNPLPTVGV